MPETTWKLCSGDSGSVRCSETVKNRGGKSAVRQVFTSSERRPSASHRVWIATRRGPAPARPQHSSSQTPSKLRRSSPRDRTGRQCQNSSKAPVTNPTLPPRMLGVPVETRLVPGRTELSSFVYIAAVGIDQLTQIVVLAIRVVSTAKAIWLGRFVCLSRAALIPVRMLCALWGSR